jgi:hypothetical protein
MALQDSRPALAAVLDHLDSHPDILSLVGAIDIEAQVDSVRVSVFVGDYDHWHHLGALVAWSRTIGAVDTVTIHGVDEANSTIHLQLEGTLADGTGVRVRTLARGRYFDLIKANVDVESAAFPLDLLRQLVAAADAEAVSA